MKSLAILLSYCLCAFGAPHGGTYKDDVKAAALQKQYVGCYNDTSTHADLPNLVYSSHLINSPKECIRMCRHQGFRYAGLQDGASCYCGNNDVRAFGESASCSEPCPGHPDLICGGQLSNDVYKVSKDARYLGCYQDDVTSPDLPVMTWDELEGKPAHECVDECAARGYKYAGVQNGGACYCGNQFGQHGEANETDCDVRCMTYGAENCGGVETNAVYLTELAYDFAKGNIDSSATKLYNNESTSITLALFTLFPHVRSIVTKTLVLHSSTEIETPADDNICSEGCYTPCSEIHQNDDLINKGKDVHLRFFYLRLSELDKYVGSHAERVWVYAQTVLIDTNMDFTYALSVRTRQLFINRASATYLNADVDEGLDTDFTGRIPDPEADLLHQKQSFMCSRILYETHAGEHHRTAWAMVSDMADTKSTNPELSAFSATVRTLRAEIAGLPRYDVHFVPFYTKSHLSTIMETYSQRIEIYQEELEKVEDAVKNKNEFLSFTKEMHLIFTTTDISEAQSSLEASKDALKRSNATYYRFQEYYEQAREDLEEAHERFEQALNDSRQSSFKNFVRDFKKGVQQIGVGIVRIVIGDVPGGVGSIIGGVDTLFDTMYNLAACMRQINQLMAMADDIMQSIDEAEDHNELMAYLDDIEMMVQLEVNIVRWENLKNYGLVILEDKEVVEIEGCAEYKRALLDFCNWGEALTRSMVECAELMRETIEKQLNLESKQKLKERVEQHFEEYENDISKEELVLWDMIEQTHDVRLDMNNLLLTFCRAFFYENMKECKAAYRPKFGGELDDILIRVNHARGDDLLNPGGGSTLARIVEITDSDTDPACRDATVCPVNYLRNNRLLFINISTDHPELTDIDTYKVARINLTFEGARSTSSNKYLKVGIESSGDFQGRSNHQVYNFMTRALTLTYEYHIESGHVSIFADVYQPYRNIIQHITPYTVWVMRVSDMRSSDIDLSGVTKIKMGLDGYGKVRAV